MSMILIKDTVSPDLARRARAAADKRPLLLAMGTAIQGLGKQAFTDSAARPHAWAPRKDPKKTHPLLLESGTLAGSIRVLPDGSDRVLIVSDRPYAAIHQLGGEHIPARPYLPFYKSGQVTGLGRKRVENALKAALRVRGL